MAELSKQYNPAAHEADTYRKWEESGAFSPDKTALDQGKKPFTIVLPPPNITGSLHMGHALQDTIMDILIRYHRMLGNPALWVPGVDHAALPTNKIIVDQLREEGTDRFKLGREKFMQRTEEWYAKTGAEILNQMKRLGCSCDWSRNRFTMDEDYINAVNEAFLRYYDQGCIYRGARIVNWDPASQTTVSDLEVDWKTEKVPLYTFKYGPFEISTARPETKFGDKYVVMHPDDKRYAGYKHGDTFEAQWINGPVTATVIKDEAAVPEFGTGVMTITPWHDQTDFAIAERHNLGKEQIIGFAGKLLPIAGEFAGMDIESARLRIVEKLKNKGLLVSVDENYEHNVALNDRGKGVIEPQIMRQWFVNMQKLKPETIAAAEKDLVKFLPARWKKHFLTWMRGVHDWNINRQIWLGHRIPVWWKPGTHGTDQEEGNYVVSTEKPDGEGWEQDPDVLDTWFSSALWPFAALGWPQDTEDLKTFYPTSVLVTGRDILYLWVARMVFSGLEFMKDIPFCEVFIHPTVLAKDGQRMSKSLGTGVDPLELIEKYGADATRFGLMYQMSYDSQSMKFDEDAIKAARNFANKIWNIARLLDLLPLTKGELQEGVVGVADQWIQSRLAHTAEEVTRLIASYKLGEAAHILHDFVWKDFADWYVEILKIEGSSRTARRVFQNILILLHPFMPFITEVLWQGEDLLIKSPWPTTALAPDTSAPQLITRFKSIVSAVRSARSLLEIPPGQRIQLYGENLPLPNAIAHMARVQLLDSLSAEAKQFPTSQGEQIFLAGAGISPASYANARKKLEKNIQKLEEFIAKQRQILANMRGQAPEEKIQAKADAIQAAEKQRDELTHSRRSLATS